MSAATAMAAINFADTPQMLVMVPVVALVSLVLRMVIAGKSGRRAGTVTPPAAGRQS